MSRWGYFSVYFYIPLNPAPNIYNKIIVPKKSVTVANTTPSDSTFIKPQINLQLVNSAGQPEGSYTTLTYNFENNSSNCQPINNNSYCAFVPSENPTKICAGLENTISSNIGCINRPRPTDSAIKLNAIHNYFIDNNCLDNSGKPSLFHSLKIQLLSNNKVIKEFPGQNAGLRDYYACYMSSSYNSPNTNKQITKESIIAGQDTINIYGTQFRSVIPKLITSSNLDISNITSEDIVKIRPENFQKTFIYPPIITSSSPASSDESGVSNCHKCFVSVDDENNCIDNQLTSKKRGQSKCSSYITPAGKRDRTSCNKNYDCYNFEDNPLPIQDVNTDTTINCYFGAEGDKDTDDYNNAEKAYCSGIYTINQQDINQQDKEKIPIHKQT